MVFALALFVTIGLPLLAMLAILWLDSDGYEESVRHRRALNKLRVDKLQREQDLDLKLREWQHTASLEDLSRHRERLESDLDAMHITVDPQVYMQARQDATQAVGEVFETKAKKKQPRSSKSE